MTGTGRGHATKWRRTKALGLAATLGAIGFQAAPAKAVERPPADAAARLCARTGPAYFRSPEFDGCRPGASARRAAARSKEGDDEIAPKFSASAAQPEASAKTSATLGALTVSHSFYGYGSRAEREGRFRLDQTMSGFSSGLALKTPVGPTFSATANAGERIVETTLELKQTFRRALPGGRSLAVTAEIGHAHEARTGRNARASFARADSPLERSFDADRTPNTEWVNLKSVYSFGNGFSAEFEQEAWADNHGGHWLLYAALRRAW